MTFIGPAGPARQVGGRTESSATQPKDAQPALPTSLQPIMTGPAVERSSRMAKYISRLSFILLAMYSVLTGLPLVPVYAQVAAGKICSALAVQGAVLGGSLCATMPNNHRIHNRGWLARHKEDRRDASIACWPIWALRSHTCVCTC